MKELMLIMAKVMPREELVDQLEKAITEYKVLQTDEKYKTVEMFCHLILCKALTEKEGDLEKTLEMTQRMQDGFNLLSPKDS